MTAGHSEKCLLLASPENRNTIKWNVCVCYRKSNTSFSCSWNKKSFLQRGNFFLSWEQRANNSHCAHIYTVQHIISDKKTYQKCNIDITLFIHIWKYQECNPAGMFCAYFVNDFILLFCPWVYWFFFWVFFLQLWMKNLSPPPNICIWS